jgi:2-haloacid dehalogenase
MPLRLVLFDLNGTLLDPAVMAGPLGGGAEERALVAAALDDAIAAAMTLTLGGRYVTFAELVGGALARRLMLAGRDPGEAEAALAAMAEMPPFPEAETALDRLAAAGLRVGVVTQSATATAEAVLERAGLRDRFELVLGTDRVGAFKPDERPYRAALEAAAVAEPADACLLAAHWWDVTGAKLAGLHTAWVSRRDRVLPPWVPEPDVRAVDLLEAAEGIVALAE